MKGFCLIFLVFAIVEADIFIPATDPRINFLGRSSIEQNTRKFDHSGIQIRLNVTNTKFVDVVMTSQSSYTYVVDNTPDGPVFLSKSGRTRVRSFSQGNHLVVLHKRNEPWGPTSVFSGIYLSDNATLGVYRNFTKRLEWLGASMMCGYGIRGPEICGANAPNNTAQNSYRNFGSIISRKFGIDNHWECQSGHGLVHGAGDNLPVYFNKSVTSMSEKWDFQRWVPHGVVFNIGTNDARANPPTSPSEFRVAYTKFMDFLGVVYGPQVQIFNTCGPMIDGPLCDVIREISNTSTRHAIIYPKSMLTKETTGCDGHPNMKGHQIMADQLAPVITKALGWNPL